MRKETGLSTNGRSFEDRHRYHFHHSFTWGRETNFTLPMSSSPSEGSSVSEAPSSRLTLSEDVPYTSSEISGEVETSEGATSRTEVPVSPSLLADPQPGLLQGERFLPLRRQQVPESCHRC